MEKQIGNTKIFEQIARGAAVTHLVVRRDGKIVGRHENMQNAEAHADVLNVSAPNQYRVQPA
jgi:hypothetical protein